MGYNAANELMHKLGMTEETGLPEDVPDDWSNY
jgi:hypothetical protein